MTLPLFRPFLGVRPDPKYADQVIAPPYDVLDTQEARTYASQKPYSFLHISKAEIDLPETISPYDPQVYKTSALNYQKMLEKGILKQDQKPCYYVYQLTMADHIQTGLAVSASVEAYNQNRVRKHEFTRPDKEDDRVRQIDALNSQTGPVLLAYYQIPAVDHIIQKTIVQKPAYSVVGDYGIRHTLWVIDAAQEITTITDAFEAQPAVYIADGHHRSAAASRVATARMQANPTHTGTEGYNSFLAVAFPISEMKILDYNRVVKDLNGLSVDDFIQALAKDFVIMPSKTAVKPDQPKTFGLFIDGQWYKLGFKTQLKSTDPVKRLDVSLLSDFVLDPILGISDLRKDKRIDFVGGMRGVGELEKRVHSGDMAVAFALYPTQMTQLIAVADSGQVMPPKSTWFEPKLADGMVSNPIA